MKGNTLNLYWKKPEPQHLLQMLKVKTIGNKIRDYHIFPDMMHITEDISLILALNSTASRENIRQTQIEGHSIK